VKLEDLKSNQSVKGLVPDAVVEVVQVDFFGADSCEVVFRKPGGGVDSQILYRSDESRLTAVGLQTLTNALFQKMETRSVSKTMDLRTYKF